LGTLVLKDFAEEDLLIVNAKSVSFHPIKITWLPLQLVERIREFQELSLE
jgi:hypothetical protein